MSDFKAKMHQNLFRLGSAPDPARGAYSAPPDAVVKLWEKARHGVPFPFLAGRGTPFPLLTR